MSPLESELESSLLELYERWKKIGPPKNIFLRMVKRTGDKRLYKGPVGTVRFLLAKREITDGFASLVIAGKLDWTVEALVIQPKWKPLFSPEELAKATTRIEEAVTSGGGPRLGRGDSMSWYKVTMSPQQITSGEHKRLQAAFDRAFVSFAAPNDAGMFKTVDVMKNEYLFSPGAVKIALPTIARYGGNECTAPRRSEVTGCVSHDDLDDIPFALETHHSAK